MEQRVIIAYVPNRAHKAQAINDMSITSLTVEKFNDGDEDKYLIRSPKEIQLILHAIAQKKLPAVVYFNDEQNFIKTIILTANEKGIWIDVGPNEHDNKRILKHEDITVVSMHQGAKIQFSCKHIEMAVYAAHPAFYCPLPQGMLRLQRRDYFRLPIPMDMPLKCLVTPKSDKPADPVEITIMDISIGGVALVCKEQYVKLEAGELYPACHIELPGIGTLVADVQVRNLFDVTSPNGLITKHAGCEFVQLDGKMSMLLQRYVGMMQSRLSGR
jgi:c-di-GMP-binding flagellar brake protein YcgR